MFRSIVYELATSQTIRSQINISEHTSSHLLYSFLSNTFKLKIRMEIARKIITSYKHWIHSCASCKTLSTSCFTDHGSHNNWIIPPLAFSSSLLTLSRYSRAHHFTVGYLKDESLLRWLYSIFCQFNTVYFNSPSYSYSHVKGIVLNIVLFNLLAYFETINFKWSAS